MPLSTSRPQQNALNQIGQPVLAPPEWSEAEDRLRRSGRLSRVKHLARTGPRRDRAALSECRGP